MTGAISCRKIQRFLFQYIFLALPVCFCAHCTTIDTAEEDIVRIFSGYEGSSSTNYMVGVESIRFGIFENSEENLTPNLVASKEWTCNSTVLLKEITPYLDDLKKKAEKGKSYRMVIELADSFGNITSRAISNTFEGTGDSTPLVLAFFMMQTNSFNLVPKLQKGVAVASASMSHARQGHASIKLPNGKVLLIGGRANESGIDITPDNADLFDPDTRTLKSIPVSGWTGGRAHFAFSKMDSLSNFDPEEGPIVMRFLIAGGETGDGIPLNEILIGSYMEGAEAIAIKVLGTLPFPAAYARAVELPGTKSVLITGGKNSIGQASDQAVLVDLESNLITPLENNLYEPRYGHAMTALPASVEGAFQGWNVLVTGGYTDRMENGSKVISTVSLVEVFTVGENTFSCFGYDTENEDCLADPCQKGCRPKDESTFATRAEHAAIPLYSKTNGEPDSDHIDEARVILVGGINRSESGTFPTYGNTEGYPSIDAWGEITCQVFGTDKLPMYEVHWDHLNTTTHTVLVVGTGNGLTDSGNRNAQIYRFSYDEGDESCRGFWDLEPIPVRAIEREEGEGVRANSPFGTNPMQVPRQDFAVTTLDNGNVMVSGGLEVSSGGLPLNTVEIYTPPIANRYSGFFDFFSTFETERIPQEECVENCGPPQPIITVDDVYANPEPLTEFKMSGLNSTSPYEDARKPFTYQWSWAPGGRPAYANEAVLVCNEPGVDYDLENDITRSGDEFTDCGETKIFFPVAGNYKFRLKVKDTAGMVSGPTTECPDCPEYCIRETKVRPSKKLYVELVWDKGGDGVRGVDMDLYLVRERDAGTFSVPHAYDDRLDPESWQSESCTNDGDCSNGFHCDTGIGFCDRICTSDQQCFDHTFGYYCNQDHASGSPTCDLHYEYPPSASQPYPPSTVYCGICSNDTSKHCGSEEDCCTDSSCSCIRNDSTCSVAGGFCSVRANEEGDDINICTKHPNDAINDTCSFQHRNPDWGTEGYENDDPSLDIDNTSGYGPETISLRKPATGKYRVIVRLFADPLGDVSPYSPATAYVQIFINGEIKSYYDPITGETTDEPISMQFDQNRTYWKVADILWDAEKEVEDLDETGDGDIEIIPYTPVTPTSPAPDLTASPYANPFRAITGPFDPMDCVDPRSIWCDALDDEIGVENYTCELVYSSIPPWCL